MDLARSYDGAMGFPHWFMAHEQTDARGRQGRHWQSPVGNLATTVALAPNCPPAQAANYSFVTALAVGDTLAAYVPTAMIGQKWPNDVLIQGCKCCGILLESASSGPMVDRLHIGIGINLSGVPQGVTGAITNPIGLGDLVDTPPSPQAVLDKLGHHFETRVTQFCNAGFASIRDDWLAQVIKLGEQITARLPNEQITGIFETIDLNGNLVLQTQAGPRNIAAADVYF